MISEELELAKTAGPADLLLDALLGRKDGEGFRVRQRPEQYAKSPVGWRVTPTAKGVGVAPRSVPGGLAGVVLRHPVLSTVLIGGLLARRNADKREAEVKRRLLGDMSVVSYAPPTTGMF